MHLFYFNECIPKSNNLVLFTKHLCTTLNEFNILLENNINIERGIVTHDDPAQCLVVDGYTLKDVIDNISDKDTRTLAYSLFSRYPIGLPYFDDSNEELISKSFEFLLEDNAYDATNLAIISYNNGYLFSLPLVPSLKKNLLQVAIRENDEKLEISNLYGFDSNTNWIRDVITNKNYSLLANYDRVVAITNGIPAKSFERDFRTLDEASQLLIIKCFEEAVNRKLSTPFCPDGDLIKDVTSEKAKRGNYDVYELRVMKGRSLRVYFSEAKGKVLLSSIGFKNNNQQDQDIDNAHKVIKKMLFFLSL